MTDTTAALLKKLRLKPGQTILLLNNPVEFRKLFSNEYFVSEEPVGQFEVTFLFAPNKTVLENLIPIAEKASTTDSIVWVAYPKGSSKIQTDLTRDKGWESMPETLWQPLNLISLDEKWSAFSFRPANGKPVKGRRALRTKAAGVKPPLENEYIDVVNKIVRLPEDLGQALAENKEALVFFDKLSFSNRKEYVNWIVSAKREETREKRVLETILKLDQGLKNPMDNGK
jgi:hypothetical protein